MIIPVHLHHTYCVLPPQFLLGNEFSPILIDSFLSLENGDGKLLDLDVPTLVGQGKSQTATPS
jgi:hypothetical protein